MTSPEKNEPIYLDYNATTPCDPRVVEAMLPYFSTWYGNAATGLHLQGRMAARAVDKAREQVATLIGCDAREIVFTSGATESNNLAILGLGRTQRDGKRKRIVTTAVEHKAVLLPCENLRHEGYEVVVLGVDAQGRVLLDEAAEAINDETLLVSVQAANNEVGTIQPVAEIAELAHLRGATVHCDAAQAVGKIAVNLASADWNVDLLSISAHKLYGPKGVGALFVRNGWGALPLEPLQYGGGQEHALRSGTTNVSGLVGFGQACLLCTEELPHESERIGKLRNEFEDELSRSTRRLTINAQSTRRLPNTSSFTISGGDGVEVLLSLPEVMMGTGSACSSGTMEPSHVLVAMGMSREDAGATIRASFGRFTTRGEMARSCSLICTRLASLEYM